MKIVRRTTALLALASVAALTLAACGSDDSSKAAASPTKATVAAAPSAATSQPTVDLSGVTLRVGDQADNHLKAILDASGEGAKAPYKISWSTFQNGPLLIAASTGGSIDLGKLSETPLVFAQAAGSPVKVVYVAKPIDKSQSALNIVVKTGSPLQSLADLKGHKVGYVQGTVLHYLLANALSSVGLKLSDVTLVNIQPGIDVLGRGDVDALVTGDPTMSAGLVAGTNRILASGAGFTPGFYYITARAGALSDPKLEAAIADFLPRLARAEVWFNSHPDDAVNIVVAQSKVTPAVAKAIVTRAPVAYGAIT
ncbi:MAG: putative sulfonate binding protein precursor, partial [Acidimicrobiia bacterium]|nr:putative sulfonate binding protein precursor [Acidimicrobiia bacterium]